MAGFVLDFIQSQYVNLKMPIFCWTNLKGRIRVRIQNDLKNRIRIVLNHSRTTALTYYICFKRCGIGGLLPLLVNTLKPYLI
jgi:hypothetical protein